MKKILLLMVLITITLSCKKSDNGTIGTVCATCEELKSHYKPADYCGTPAAVDAYITTLKKDGAAAGQNWSCTKH